MGRPTSKKSRKISTHRYTKAQLQDIINVQKTFRAQRAAQRGVECVAVNKQTAKMLHVPISIVSHAQQMMKHLRRRPAKHSQRHLPPVPAERAANILQAKQDLLTEHAVVTVQSITDRVNAHRLPQDELRHTTVYNSMRQMGLHYSKPKDYYQRMRERPSIVESEKSFVTKLWTLRATGWNLAYLDESWLNVNMSTQKQWVDKDGNGAYDIPPGKGARLMLAHVFDPKAGLVDGCLLQFESNQTPDSDYHGDMNHEVFYSWMKYDVLPHFTEPTVFVMDNASYHVTLTKDTKPVYKTLKKADLIQWILSHRTSFTLKYLEARHVPELRELAAQIAPRPLVHIAKLCAKYNHLVLFTPVACPDLNPIEKMWGYLKKEVRQRNTGPFNMTTLKKHFKDALAVVKSKKLFTSATAYTEKAMTKAFKTTAPKPQ